MPSVNQTAIRAARIITPEEELKNGLVLLKNGVIEYVGVDRRDLPEEVEVHSGSVLIPGMIDLHINGSGGGDAAEGTPEALEKMSRSLASHGTTGFLPTIITDHEENLVRSLQALSAVLDESYSGARPLGIHLEGPFLCPEKRGAHPLECVQEPSLDKGKRFLEASRGRMKMLTLAPEMEGALEVIEQMRRCIPLVSLGHSDSDYDTAIEAVGRGANFATHIFNAMPTLHHRDPGLTGAVLDAGIPVEIIADGIHVHPAMVRLVLRCKGPRQVVLVTDAISAADMPDGTHQVGSLKVTVENGVCRNEEGRLAGSSLTMDTGLQNMQAWSNGQLGSLGEVVAMATLQPARLLGLERKGRIQTGCDADLALLDEALRVQKTWVAGRLAHNSERPQG